MIVGPGLRVTTKQTSDPNTVIAFWRKWDPTFRVFEKLEPRAIAMGGGMTLFLQHRRFGYLGGEVGTVEFTKGDDCKEVLK